MLYITNCPFLWARGIVNCQGCPGVTELDTLVDVFSTTICGETGKALPVEVVHLAVILQSGLPREEDYNTFLEVFPEGEIKERTLAHLAQCRRSPWWGGLWAGWVRR